MQATAGVNYKPLGINYQRARDALLELSLQHKRVVPDLSTQREWIAAAIAAAQDCHATHRDFFISRVELGWQMEDALYNTLEAKLLGGK